MVGLAPGCMLFGIACDSAATIHVIRLLIIMAGEASLSARNGMITPYSEIGQLALDMMKTPRAVNILLTASMLMADIVQRIVDGQI